MATNKPKKNRRKKKKDGLRLNKMDIYLMADAALFISFVAAVLFVYCRMGSAPDALIIVVGAFCGGECGLLAMIKSAAERNKEREWEKEDRRELGRSSTGDLPYPGSSTTQEE